ncbi:hypothetical protein [Sulfurimonas sp.]|uniref:hypothetical protein n=1 Tax=Sulfurimonas sp. TaxID=2022749 RepID=UPI003564E959
MGKFYFFLWLGWAYKLSLDSIVISILITSIITFLTYAKLGFVSLDQDVLNALFKVFKFYFSFVFSIILLVVLFRSIKYVFNKCIHGYELKLLSCDQQEIIENIGYGDLLRVWRKWIILLIWLVAICMIVTMFNFFNIYALYISLLLSGYISFVIMISKCKKIKVIRC